jgi:hypothetical protein
VGSLYDEIIRSWVVPSTGYSRRQAGHGAARRLYPPEIAQIGVSARALALRHRDAVLVMQLLRDSHFGRLH